MKAEILISRDALRSNYGILAAQTSGVVWPVIKSNAYGHGSREVVSCLDDFDFTHYIVQNYFEAEELFDHTEKKFFVLGYQNTEDLKCMDAGRVAIAVPSLSYLQAIIELGLDIEIHLEINTGMNRHGIEPQEIIAALRLIKDSNLKLVGLMTHFASADEPDLASLRKQEHVFREIMERFPGIQYLHSHNSAGSITSKLTSNVVRAGILLYGLIPFEQKEITPAGIVPVLKLRTYITSLRTIAKGSSVGYGDAYVAEKDMLVATIPVGYYEGVVRALSNKGYVLVGDVMCRIIGRVSMNITIIDVSLVEDVVIGSEVLVISDKKGVAIDDHAKHCGTIHYEITTNIKPHIPRRII